ncbi:MAG: site-specific integrase, partial [Patescibacteria group bacterium]
MNQTQELLRHFQAFLEEAKLSRVSIKNYVSDVRQFLNWSQISSALLVTHQQIQDYQAQIKNTKPPATYQRYLASMRQFVSFLAIEYRINLPPITVVEEVLTSKDLTNQFKAYLTKEKRSHSTIKNYVSDLNHYWSWSANNQSADIPAYLNHLKLSHTKTSVAHRREAALNKFLKFTTDAKLIAPPSVIPSILEGSSRFLHYG